MVRLPWQSEVPNGRLVRFADTEAVLFDVFNDGDELRGVEVGGDRRERWPRAAAAVYASQDGPMYLINATIPQVADASLLVGLEERIAFSALNEATQETRWTYTTILLCSCLIGMLFILVLVWQANGSASEAKSLARITFDAVDKLSRVTPTPLPVR